MQQKQCLRNLQHTQIRKDINPKIKNQNFPLRKLAKEKQIKSKVRIYRGKERVRIRAVIKETENRKSIGKINKNKSWFFKRINKIRKPLPGKVTKKERVQKLLTSQMKEGYHYRSH